MLCWKTVLCSQCRFDVNDIGIVAVWFNDCIAPQRIDEDFAGEVVLSVLLRREVDSSVSSGYSSLSSPKSLFFLVVEQQKKGTCEFLPSLCR